MQAVGAFSLYVNTTTSTAALQLTKTHSGAALQQGERDDPSERSQARNPENGQDEDQGDDGLADQDDELREDGGCQDLQRHDSGHARPVTRKNLLVKSHFAPFH